MGQDPFIMLGEGQQNYDLRLVMLKKAVEIDLERRKAEAEIIGAQIARVIAAMLAV